MSQKNLETCDMGHDDATDNNIIVSMDRINERNHE